jgi:hypothetical protein
MKLSAVHVMAFPSTASNIYIGGVSSGSSSQLSDSQINLMHAQPLSAFPMSHSINTGAERAHICVALPTIAGDISLAVNGSPAAVTSITRNFIGPTGLIQLYTISVTTVSFSQPASITISSVS